VPRQVVPVAGEDLGRDRGGEHRCRTPVPDTIPQLSRRRVALVLFSDVFGVIAPVVTAPVVANV